MGSRILKESVCISDTIDKLSWFDEVFFYRLMVCADDYGRFDGRAAIIKGRLFPLKSVTEKQIADSLNTLSSVGLVMPYDHDGKPILQIVTWDKHQRIRNKRSKYPAADGSDEMSATDNVNLILSANGEHLTADCGQVTDKCRSHAQNPNPNTNTNTNTKDTPPTPQRGASDPENLTNTSMQTRFDTFWKAYPRKTDKGHAINVWKRLKPDDKLLDQMLDAIEAQKRGADWTKNNGQYIPMPSTWLNGRRWEDETIPSVQTASPAVPLVGRDGMPTSDVWDSYKEA